MAMRVCVFSIGSLFLTLVCACPLRADDVLTVVHRLSHQHLAYIYGSEDPGKGGLDCSGFVEIVFRQSCGIELPNEADKQLEYCRQHGRVWDSTSGWTPGALQPGDLIFFAGPDALPRSSLVTHVMIYCGNNTMAGAQGMGRQEDGVFSGVGEYYFHPHYPDGVWGESGERFIGHRRVFAYGRLTFDQGPATHEIVAKVQRSRPARLTGGSATILAKPFGMNSRIE